MAHAKWIAKAIVAGATAFIAAVVTGLSNDGVMQAAEWWIAAGSGVVALGATFQIPNGAKPLTNYDA